MTWSKGMSLSKELIDSVEIEFDEIVKLLNHRFPEDDAKAIARRELVASITKLLNEW